MKRIEINYQDGWFDPDKWYWMKVINTETGELECSETSESSQGELPRIAATALLIDYLHRNPDEPVEIRNLYKENSDLAIIVEAHNHAALLRKQGKGEKYFGQIVCEIEVERRANEKRAAGVSEPKKS
jgi:hypothetical protein